MENELAVFGIWYVETKLDKQTGISGRKVYPWKGVKVEFMNGRPTVFGPVLWAFLRSNRVLIGKGSKSARKRLYAKFSHDYKKHRMAYRLPFVDMLKKPLNTWGKQQLFDLCNSLSLKDDLRIRWFYSISHGSWNVSRVLYDKKGNQIARRCGGGLIRGEADWEPKWQLIESVGYEFDQMNEQANPKTVKQSFVKAGGGMIVLDENTGGILDKGRIK